MIGIEESTCIYSFQLNRNQHTSTTFVRINWAQNLRVMGKCLTMRFFVGLRARSTGANKTFVEMRGGKSLALKIRCLCFSLDSIIADVRAMVLSELPPSSHTLTRHDRPLWHQQRGMDSSRATRIPCLTRTESARWTGKC